MQITAISNTKSDVKFKSATTTDKASAFVNMSDSQIRMISYVSGKDKNKEKKNKNSLLRMFYAIPVVDTIASAVLVNKNTKLSDEAVKALRKTRLSTRLAAAAGTAGFWAISLSAIELYSIAKKAVASKAPKAKKFDRENPATALLADIAAILGLGALGVVGLNKLSKNSSLKHPERAAKADRTIREARVLINRSKFSKEILPKLVENMEKFAEKYPGLAKKGRNALANSVLIMFGLSILKSMGHAKNERDRVENNYRNLKQTQLNVAKQLVTELHQDKIALAEELKTTVEEKKHAEEEVAEIKNNCCDTAETIDEPINKTAEDIETVEEQTETESVNE